jgi:Domain of unknown function (DUF4082)
VKGWAIFAVNCALAFCLWGFFETSKKIYRAARRWRANLKKKIPLAILLVVFSAVSARAQCTAAAPCTLFGTAAPTGYITDTSQKAELGIEFYSATAGTIAGVRFYKLSTDTSTSHTVHLWSAAGALLATASSSGETASGWQSAAFATPVAITATTNYVASYGNMAASFPKSSGFFSTTAFSNGSLHAPLNAAATPQAPYGAVGAFPNTANGGNYWVDVLFLSPAPAASLVTAILDNGETSIATINPALSALSLCTSSSPCTSAIASGSTVFTVSASGLTITAVSPMSGPAGTAITLTGTGYSSGMTGYFTCPETSTASSSQYAITITYVSATELTSKVPTLPSSLTLPVVCSITVTTPATAQSATFELGGEPARP